MRPRHIVRCSAVSPRIPAALVALAVLVPCVASAEPIVLRFRGGVDVAGSYDSQLRSEALTGDGSDTDPVVEALLPSMGGGAAFEVPLHPYASVGAGLYATSWLTEPGDALGLGRNRWYDFDLELRGRYPLLGRTLGLYLAVPVGLTVNVFSPQAVDSAGARWGHGLGWNLSLLLGAEYRFTNGGSVFLETGWVHRQFTHETTGMVFGTPARIELDGSVDQLALHLGLGFELTRDLRVGLDGREPGPQGMMKNSEL